MAINLVFVTRAMTSECLALPGRDSLRSQEERRREAGVNEGGKRLLTRGLSSATLAGGEHPRRANEGEGDWEDGGRDVDAGWSRLE